MPFSAGQGGAAAIAFEYDVSEDRWTCSPDMKAIVAVPPGQEPASEQLLPELLDHQPVERMARILQHLGPASPTN